MPIDYVRIEPVDSWFFRGTRPYRQGESNQADVRSQFPPDPPTVVGALRAELARRNGWDGRSGWGDRVRGVLGDGPFDLGRMSFLGPYLTLERRGSEAVDLLFPAPMHLLGCPRTGDQQKWEPRAFLRPGPPVECDLGVARLPISTEVAQGLKTPDGLWITASGLGRVLEGQLPSASDLLPSSQLFRREHRVGLERDQETRTALEEGALYSPAHIRLKQGVALGAGIGGRPQDWQSLSQRPFPFGGESRLASCQPWDFPGLPKAPQDVIQQTRCCSVVLLTPASFTGEGWRTPEGDLEGLPGVRVASACLGRPQFIGGWDGRPNEMRPLAARPCLPAGSTFFCEIEPAAMEEVLARPVGNLGDARWQAHGFGQFVLGCWP